MSRQVDLRRARAKPLHELGPGFHIGQDREGFIYFLRQPGADRAMRELVRYAPLDPLSGENLWYEEYVWQVPKAGLELVAARGEVP